MDNRKSKNLTKRSRSSLVTKQDVRKMIKSFAEAQIEDKYFVLNSGPTSIDFNGTVQDMMLISQGLSDLNRIGDEIRITSMSLNLQVIGVDATNLMRVVIFKWRPATVPSVASILSFGGGTANAPLSALNRDRSVDYKIYYDHTFALSTATNVSQAVSIKHIPLKGLCQYQAGTTSGTNHLYLLVISDSGAVPNPSLQFMTRVNFTDA